MEPPTQNMERNPSRRRPRTAYILFCKAFWRTAMNELRTTNSRLVIPNLARRWRCLSAADRNKYYEMARKEKIAMRNGGGGGGGGRCA
jgi:hypothetical protein